MSRTWYKEETSAEITGWLKGLRVYAPRYIFPASRTESLIVSDAYLFDEELLRRRQFVVAPLFEYWIVSEDPALPVLKSKRYDRIYGTGLRVNKELFLSCSVEINPLQEMINEWFGICLLTPRNEDFFMLHTSSDYWLLAGPPSLVEAMIGQTLKEAFDCFQDAVFADGGYEPGPELGGEILARYRRHNHLVLTSTGKP